MSPAHFGLGLAYNETGDTKRSIKELKRAIELDPKVVQPRTSLALVYLNLGEA